VLARAVHRAPAHRSKGEARGSRSVSGGAWGGRRAGPRICDAILSAFRTICVHSHVDVNADRPRTELPNESHARPPCPGFGRFEFTPTWDVTEVDSILASPSPSLRHRRASRIRVRPLALTRPRSAHRPCEHLTLGPCWPRSGLAAGLSAAARSERTRHDARRASRPSSTAFELCGEAWSKHRLHARGRTRCASQRQGETRRLTAERSIRSHPCGGARTQRRRIVRRASFRLHRCQRETPSGIVATSDPHGRHDSRATHSAHRRSGRPSERPPAAPRGPV